MTRLVKIFDSYVNPDKVLAVYPMANPDGEQYVRIELDNGHADDYLHYSCSSLNMSQSEISAHIACELNHS